MANKVSNPTEAGTNRMPRPNGSPQQMPMVVQPVKLPDLPLMPESFPQIIGLIEQSSVQLAQAMVPVAGGAEFAGSLRVRNTFRIIVRTKK